MAKSAASAAKSLMLEQRNKMAWPTLVASITLIAIFVGAVCAHIFFDASLWICAPISFFTIHMSFAVAHEATHKTISNNPKNAWIDYTLGTLHSWMLLYDFPTFKFLHLRHHANTNDPALDPDYWLQKHSIPVGLFLGLFVPLHYLRMFIIAASHGAVSKRFTFFALLRIAVIILVLISLLIIAPISTFFLWLAPSSIASAIISVSHRLLHTIEETADRKKTTLIVRGEKLWEWIVSPFFWLNNHHFLHHEYPKLPCYTHEKLFNDTKEQLAESGVQIITFGASRKTRAKP